HRGGAGGGVGGRGQGELVLHAVVGGHRLRPRHRHRGGQGGVGGGAGPVREVVALPGGLVHVLVGREVHRGAGVEPVPVGGPGDVGGPHGRRVGGQGELVLRAGVGGQSLRSRHSHLR